MTFLEPDTHDLGGGSGGDGNQVAQGWMADDEADVGKQVGGVDRVSDQSIGAARLDAAIGGDHPERPSQRQDGNDLEAKSCRLEQLTGQYVRSRGSGPKEQGEHGPRPARGERSQRPIRRTGVTTGRGQADDGRLEHDEESHTEPRPVGQRHAIGDQEEDEQPTKPRIGQHQAPPHPGWVHGSEPGRRGHPN